MKITIAQNEPCYKFNSCSTAVSLRLHLGLVPDSGQAERMTDLTINFEQVHSYYERLVLEDVISAPLAFGFARVAERSGTTRRPAVD